MEFFDVTFTPAVLLLVNLVELLDEDLQYNESVECCDDS